MQIEIDLRRAQPPSEQIAEQVRFAIARGDLRVGERLPSVRALAVQAVVNPNTVGKAWRDLEREGVLVSRPGDGVFVAENAIELCNSVRERVLRERLVNWVDDARSAGLARADVDAWFAEVWPSSRSLRAVRGAR